MCTHIDLYQCVYTILSQQWGLGEAGVQFIPMNRGFFIIKLLTQDDKDKVFKDGNKNPWIVNDQPLRLIEWYPGFDADKQCTSHSTVWVKFPSLPVEMWVEKTLLALGKSLGTPIVVDKRTLNHEYGHYASVLIDIDFAKHDTDSVYVEVDGRHFLQPIEILKQPKFCSKCKIVGHLDKECRKKHAVNALHAAHARTDARKNQPQTLVIHQGENNDTWQTISHKKNGKKNKKDATDTRVQVDVVRISTADYEQQLQEDLIKSEAAMRTAAAMAEKAVAAHSVLVSRAKSLSTVALNTKPGGNLWKSSEYVSSNKFNILDSTLVGETASVHELGHIDEVARKAKHQQLLAFQARLDTLRDVDV
ncbi:uncharacterized protein LOC113343064 [Papaver somniferum]|uniref:uncharacterized protein LOC113343064 n=1 Tax=Papaver somniferum TaxID=3469 RepID=UPI000E702931|nr:uncharacterized protein LOC113343064 [Papaver somniferum]